jgi:predicted protein tyrosine phosphatase
MKHPQILVLGYSEAGMLLKNPGDTNVRAIISIHGQREYAIDYDELPYRLVLQFDDTEAPRDDDPIQVARTQFRQREAMDSSAMLTPPTMNHAKSIIDFANAIAEMEGTLLCQCQGGISRSPAAALLCLAAWNGEGNEQYCVERVLSVRPSAVPHRDLVEFGDMLLRRKGKLITALQHKRPF